MQLLRFTIILLAFAHISLGAQAQAWKNAENRHAINKEADFKKRIANNEAALKKTKDPELQKIYQERIDLFKGGLDLVKVYQERIESGNKLNAQRTKELMTLTSRKGEAMQMLVLLRTTEAVHEGFKTELKDEIVPIFKEARQKTYDYLRTFDQAMSKVEALIK